MPETLDQLIEQAKSILDGNWLGQSTKPSPHYPKGVLTSGITMPPVHAMAALRVLRHATNGTAAREWLQDLYPRILALHEYFYRHRDPLGPQAHVRIVGR